MKLCSVEGCNRKHHGHGYCKAHLKQFNKYGYIKDKDAQYKEDVIQYENYAELIIRDTKGNEVARTKIDKEDIDRICICKWNIKENLDGSIYIRNKINGYLHRFILNCNDNDKQVDHINHDTLDNRKSNLRICSSSENRCNVRVGNNNKLGIKNINLTRNNTYQVRITKNGKVIHKNFKTLEEAIEWRDNKLEELHGEFACKGE